MVLIQYLLIKALLSHILQNTPVSCSESTPPGIDTAFEPYRTWGQGIEVDELLLVAYPKSTSEVEQVVNWANKVGRKVRPRGHDHTFAPLTLTKDAVASDLVLIDLTRHLTKMEMVTIPPDYTVHGDLLFAVKVQTGASWKEFLTYCEENKFGLAHSINIGDASVGGVLALGTHGAAIPAKGEDHRPGFTFGSLSNLITAFDAIVWDDEKNAYAAKTFYRWDADSEAFLAHVGRALLTEVTILVGDSYNLRCKSITDIPAEELFADPEVTPNLTRTFVSFLDSTGRAEAQLYQFAPNPWLKVWSIVKNKPAQSFKVNGPFNYQFPVNVKIPSLTVPELGELAFKNVLKGLASKNARDIWGPSKNILLYSNSSSEPSVYGGSVILTSRSKLQHVLSKVFSYYKDLNEEYAIRAEYPIDYYIQFRVTGLDNAKETLLEGARETLLSPISPCPDNPHFDVALWINTFTKRENPLGNQFMRRFEQFIFENFRGNKDDGLARAEWSQSWGYSDQGPFLNRNVLERIIPQRYGANWNRAINILNKYDPHRIYSNSFLDGLFSV